MPGSAPPTRATRPQLHLTSMPSHPRAARPGLLGPQGGERSKGTSTQQVKKGVFIGSASPLMQFNSLHQKKAIKKVGGARTPPHRTSRCWGQGWGPVQPTKLGSFSEPPAKPLAGGPCQPRGTAAPAPSPGETLAEGVRGSQYGAVPQSWGRRRFSPGPRVFVRSSRRVKRRRRR